MDDTLPTEIDLEERARELRADIERLKKIKALRDAYGINFYRPHWKQHKFHICDAVGRYGRTGNRFGKSEMGIAEDIAYCMGGRMWYRETFDIKNGRREVVEHHVGSLNHPYVTVGIPRHAVKGLLLVVDWDMAKKIFTNHTDDPKTCGKLFKLLPREAIGNVHQSRGGHIDQIEIKRPTEFGGGVSTLTIDTIEAWKHNKLGSESADWDFIHVDEPVPEPMFEGFSRGLMDRNGRYWFTCTPLSEMWINDRFTPNRLRIVADTGDNGFEFEKEGKVKHFIISGSTYDNPYRNDLGVEAFAASLSSEQRATRLDGKPAAYAGLVFSEFEYDAHVLQKVPAGWKAWNEPPLNYTIRVWWDDHIRLPQALLYFATAPNGTVFVYNEQYFSNSISENAEACQSQLAGRNVATMEIDPDALIEHPVSERSLVDTLMDYDLYFSPASKDRSQGINLVKQWLAERDHEGLPTVFFGPSLTQTLYEFAHWTFDTEKNKPIDKHDHMMSNLYRAKLSGLDYIPLVDASDYANRRGVVISGAEHLKPLRRS